MTGCGGDDDALNNGELVKKANAFCKRHTQKIGAASGKLLAGGQLPSPREFGKLAQGTIVPEVGAQVKELRALEPPDDMADDSPGARSPDGAPGGRVVRLPVPFAYIAGPGYEQMSLL